MRSLSYLCIAEAALIYIYIYIYRSEGFVLTGYDIPGCADDGVCLHTCLSCLILMSSFDSSQQRSFCFNTPCACVAFESLHRYIPIPDPTLPTSSLFASGYSNYSLRKVTRRAEKAARRRDRSIDSSSSANRTTLRIGNGDWVDVGDLIQNTGCGVRVSIYPRAGRDTSECGPNIGFGEHISTYRQRYTSECGSNIA